MNDPFEPGPDVPEAALHGRDGPAARDGAPEDPEGRAGAWPDGDRPAATGPRELRETVRAAGRELGFDQVGFAPAERPVNADAYLRWLERDWHGDMEYMEREDSVRRRLAPREALDGCRTLIVVSMRYAGPEGAGLPPGAGDPLSPVVARYASRGVDYHDVFEDRLQRLAERLEALVPGARSKPYVDYGPVLERDHAQRAGLGWVGKNTVLIDPDLGSYLLLGELLTDVALPPDEPFAADRCGTCSRCIEACPTDAIRGPRELDARRCISYLTIELRGPIPPELRPLVGNRVFGCDICQEVCPWNRKVPSLEVSPLDAEPAGARSPDAALTDATQPGRPVPPPTMVAWAESLLGMDQEEFRDRYRDTPFYRPYRKGLLRNLCVGLGNSGRPEAVPVLVRALEDESALVRGHAAWALGRLASDEAVSALAAGLARESDPFALEELERALLDAGSTQTGSRPAGPSLASRGR